MLAISLQAVGCGAKGSAQFHQHLTQAVGGLFGAAVGPEFLFKPTPGAAAIRGHCQQAHQPTRLLPAGSAVCAVTVTQADIAHQLNMQTLRHALPFPCNPTLTLRHL